MKEVPNDAPKKLEPAIITITHGLDGKVKVQGNMPNQMTMLGLLDFAKSVITREILNPPAKEEFTPSLNPVTDHHE